jgi:hypothetical protein
MRSSGFAPQRITRCLYWVENVLAARHRRGGRGIGIDAQYCNLIIHRLEASRRSSLSTDGSSFDEVRARHC